MRCPAAWAVLASILACLSLTPVRVAGAAEGIAIGHVEAGGPSDQIGFHDNDILHQVNGQDVSNWDQFKQKLHAAPGTDYTFTVERMGACWFLSATAHIDNNNYGYSQEGVTNAPASACGMATTSADRPGTIGLRIQTVPSELGKGALVASIAPGSPAEKAGLRVGDIIRKVDSNPASNQDDAADKIKHSFQSGSESITLNIDRDRRPLTFTVPFIKAASIPVVPASVTALYPIPSLGLSMASGNWTNGVPVRKVDPGSPAARARLVAGDLVTMADTVRISNAAMLYRKAEDFSERELRIFYTRSGKEYYTSIDIAGAPLPPAPPVVASNPPAADSAPEPPAPPLRQPATEPPQVASPSVSVPAAGVTAPSAISTTVTLVMSVLLVLVLAALAVARRKGWGKGFSLRPASAGGPSFAPTSAPDDEEEREIALARQAVETAERSPDQASPSTEIGGPSWLQQQRERREVERARRSMEEAERIAARGPTQPPGYYPYPPPPYAYHTPRRPLSEWFRVAYWGIKIALVLTVAIWAWSVTGTVVSMLGAIVPAPLRAATVELLAKAQDSISKADTTSK